MTLIINNNKSRNKFIVILETLIRVVLTALLWYFLLRHIFEMLVFNNYVKTIQIFKFLGIISLIAFIILFVWQSYNLHLFGSLDRRKARSAATNEDLANRFGIAQENLDKLGTARSLSLKKSPLGGNDYYTDTFVGYINTQLDPNPLVFNRKNPKSAEKK